MSELSKLGRVLTLADVQMLADEKTFARGTAYFHEGAVSRLEEYEGLVRARVRGTHSYRVQLTAADDRALSYQCDCPVGNDGTFCKHAVAVALSWLANSGEEVFHAEETTGETPYRRRETYAEVIREYVATLGKDALRELVLQAVERDRTLRDKLLLAARLGQTSDLSGMKAAVRQATRISRPLDWREAGAYGDSLMSLAGMLRQRLSGPHAATVLELSESAIAGAEKSLEQIDDSGGEVMPSIVELASVHLDACKQARPNPVKLAQRLFRLQTEGAWGTFYDVLPAYTEALGESGLHRYRQLVSEAWEALPALHRGNQCGKPFDARRMTLEHAMQGLAELDGDVDALICIRSKDLSSPYRYLLVAELCVKHGRADEGIAWAERGLREPGWKVDTRLLDFCAEAYLRRGESRQADAVAWSRFQVHPTAEAFSRLMAAATATGTYDETRKRAVQYFRTLVVAEETAVQSKRNAWRTPIRTELVKIFLSENKSDEAWDAFIGGPVATHLWPQMAAVRGMTHPHDAIAIYRRLLPLAAERGTRKARYDEAFEVVRSIGRLRKKLGEGTTFANELEKIRATYCAKRNFIKMLATLS